MWVCCQLQSYRVNQIDRAVDKQVTMSPAPFILIQCALPQLPVDAQMLTTQCTMRRSPLQSVNRTIYQNVYLAPRFFPGPLFQMTNI